MVAMNNGGEKRVVVKRGRGRDSSPDTPDAKKTRTFSSEFPIRQHGRYECLSNVQAQTYENAVLMTEFVFENLIREVNLHRWRRNGELWLQSLPFPDGIDYKNVKQYISNGYLVFRNLLLATQRNSRELIQIGGNRKTRSKSRPGEAGMDADADTSKGAAHGARRGKTAQEDATWTPSGGAYAAPPPRPAADLRRCRVGAGGAAAADEEEEEGSDASEDDEAAGDAAGSAEE